MKKVLAYLGLSALVLVVGVVFLVAACALGCLFYVWRKSSTVAPEPGVAAASAPADFDGPLWALARYRRHRVGILDAHETFAWRSLAAAEFDRVGPARARLPAATLLCRVSMERVGWDQTVTAQNSDGRVEEYFTGTAAPDMAATLEVSGAPARDAFGPEDQHETTVAFPLTALPDGATIKLRVCDRDLAVNDEAGESSVLYDGNLPIRFTGRRFSAECRGIPPERASALAEPPIRALEALIRRFEIPWIAGNDDLWTVDTRVAVIQRALGSLADWLGWAHPDVRRLVAEADGVPRELPRQVAVTLGALPLTRSVRLSDSVRWSLLRWGCGAAVRGRCGVRDDEGCVAEFELGRFDDTQMAPVERESSFLFGPEGKIPAAAFEPLPRSRQYCMAFDTHGAAPTLRDGTAPAVLLFLHANAPVRVQ